MADACGFLAMGCDEILVHSWDAGHGLGIDFKAPADLAERVLTPNPPIRFGRPPWRHVGDIGWVRTAEGHRPWPRAAERAWWTKA
ncbi:MAG: hypothetical protein ACRD0A_15910, partial [Acidimicrobiales bacterium]